MCIGLPRYHPLIVGTLDLLPDWDHDATWDEDGLAAWLNLAEANLRALYHLPPAVRPPAWRPAWWDAAAGAEAALHAPRSLDDPDLDDATAAEARDAEAALAYAAGAGDRLAQRLIVPGAAERLVARIADVHYPPDDAQAARRAAALEAELHPPLDDLEREAMRPVPPPPTDNGRRSILEGGHYNRSGQFVHKLRCTFPAAGGDACGAICSGEGGMRGHLARGHDLRGVECAISRESYVAEAIANAEAADLEPPDAGDDEVHVDDLLEAVSAGDVDLTANGADRGVLRPGSPDPGPVDQVEELRAAAEHSPGAARLLELRRAYLDRVEARTHKLDRFAIADELGVSRLTAERWHTEAYAALDDDEPATLDAPAATTPERPAP